MAEGKLKGVVCTSTLDLGIDWGDVDLVINVGAPKGASRLMQRIGRANHRLDEPSRAILIPANRFEALECRAAIDAAREGAQDSPPLRTGALDVLCQHILGMACAAPFSADALYDEVRSAEPYARLSREDFDAALDFVATGGYALKTYDRFAKIRINKDGLWRVANPRIAQSWRMNVGTIVESDMLKVRLVRGRAKKVKRARVRRRQHAVLSRKAARRRGLAALVHGAVGARRARAGRDRGILSRNAEPRRHVRVRRRNPRARRHRRERGAGLARQFGRAESAVLCGRQVSALHLPRRARAQARVQSAQLARAARAGARMAGDPEARVAPARARAIFWSRRFRAAGASISSPTRSRGASRTRRSACC